VAYSIDRCPACASLELTERPAIISPFLTEYVFGGQGGGCTIAACRRCGLQFFTSRLSETETARLYAGYRGEPYFTARHRHEFWYTRRFQDRLGSGADIGIRRDQLHQTLARHVDPVAIGSVLDYGGDRGQILSDGPGRLRYVFDLSGVQPVTGIQGLPDEAALGRTRVDLVLLCEVLEHASEPVGLLQRMGSLLLPGGLVFVTVPHEQLSFADIPTGAWYRRYVSSLQRHPALLKWIDFYSTASRVKFRRIPPFGLVKMHEHLNLFTPAALGHALEAAGFEILECQLASSAGPIVALARYRHTEPQGSSST
jgi:hypothetical protein